MGRRGEGNIWKRTVALKKKTSRENERETSFGRPERERESAAKKKEEEDGEKRSFSRDKGQVHTSFSISARATGNVLSNLLRIKSRHSIAPLHSNRSFWSPFSSFPRWRARETARPSRASPLAFPSFLPSIRPRAHNCITFRFVSTGAKTVLNSFRLSLRRSSTRKFSVGNGSSKKWCSLV